MRVIELVQEKCNQIVEEHYECSKFKPYVIISQMYQKGYLLTLIYSEDKGDFDSRQSEFIDLDTNLEKTIELLYNRTM
jgi:hypothetical protein